MFWLLVISILGSLLSTTRFAVLPAFIEPVCFSMPITFAPLMVAACRASKGVKPARSTNNCISWCTIGVTVLNLSLVTSVPAAIVTPA